MILKKPGSNSLISLSINFFGRYYRMIERGIIKLFDIVYAFSMPPEEALIGMVNKIEYPIVTLDVIKRDGSDKFKNQETIDLSKDSALTVLSEKKQEQILTTNEIKRLRQIEQEDEIMDMFSGTY